jgi:hypothetical protein
MAHGPIALEGEQRQNRFRTGVIQEISDEARFLVVAKRQPFHQEHIIQIRFHGFSYLHSLPQDFGTLLAICLESFMERDFALWKVPVERESEEHLRRNAFEAKAGDVLKPKLPVVFRMPD